MFEIIYEMEKTMIETIYEMENKKMFETTIQNNLTIDVW